MSFRAPFYLKFISREQAEEILRGRETGSFLLRKSVQQKSYALSIAYQNNVIHYRINKNEQAEVYYLQNDSGSPFSSLEELCQFHMENKGMLKSKLLHPVTSTKPLKGNSYVPSPSNKQFPVVNNKPPLPIPKNFQSHDMNRLHDNQEHCIPRKTLMLNPQSEPLPKPRAYTVPSPAPPSAQNYYLQPNEINSPSPVQVKEFNLNINEGSNYTDFEQTSLPGNFFAYTECDWYHGPIDSDESFARLSKMYKKHKLDGIFLVRSKTESLYVLELIKSGKTCKFEIQQEHSTKQFKISDKIQKFYTLKELVDFLRVNNGDATGLQCNLKVPCQIPKKSQSFRFLFRNSKSPSTFNIDLQDFKSANIPRKALTLGKVLGSGNFGEVKQGILKTGTSKIECAVKTLKSSNKKLSGSDKKKNRSELENERDIMVHLNHPNIVRLLGMCDDNSGMLLVLELVHGGSLNKYLENKIPNNFPMQEQVMLMLHICNGMKYLSEQNIIHRDLAARNILLDSNNIPKIADFGMARLRSEGLYVQWITKEGPVRWYAPECLGYNTYTSKSDVWSFGVTMWEISTCGRHVPYHDVSTPTLFNYLETGNRLRMPESCPIEIFLIMAKCWEKDPERRPDFNELYMSLQHPY